MSDEPDDMIDIPNPFSSKAMGEPSADPEAFTIPIATLRGIMHPEGDTQYLGGEYDDDEGLDLVN